jgi:hypothetical protein
VFFAVDSEELFALAGDESAIGTKNTNVTTKNNAKAATTNANKKGKTRTRGTKNSRLLSIHFVSWFSVWLSLFVYFLG